MTQTIAELTNSGIEEPINVGDPTPKYAIGQNIFFTGQLETGETYTAFGEITGFQPFAGKVYYAIEVMEGQSVGDNSSAAIQWIEEKEGLTVQILEGNIKTPAPKFSPDQPVTFSITLTATALVDGEPVWDYDAEKYFYSVKNVKVTDIGSRPDDDDIYLEEISVKVDEGASTLQEKQLSEGSILLPRCKFDPN